MKKIPVILLLVLVAVLVVPTVSAIAPIVVTPNNSSAQQLGGAYNPYTFVSGDDTYEVFTAVPLTLEGVSYPVEFWYVFIIISFLFLALGIHYASLHTHIPSIAIMACGLLAWGGFWIAAFMAPHVAQVYVEQSVVPHILASGASAGNNTVYVTQVVDYRESPEHARILWGLGVAGFIEFILGVMSLLGWLKRKGIGDATKGEYLETDGEMSREQYKRGI